MTRHDLGSIPGACEPTRIGYPPVAHVPAVRTPLPDLDTCGHDEVIDLAHNALHRDDDLWALSGSSLHIRAICQQVERMDLDLIAAQDIVTEQQRVIAHQQTELHETRQRLADAELLLRTERDRLEAEAVMHHETMLRLMTAQGRFALVRAELLKLQGVVDMYGAALTRFSTVDDRPAQRIIDVSDSAPDKEVIDMDQLDEPPVSRTITPKVYVPEMRQLVGGGS